jgi:hypothetical protein
VVSRSLFEVSKKKMFCKSLVGLCTTRAYTKVMSDYSTPWSPEAEDRIENQGIYIFLVTDLFVSVL